MQVVIERSNVLLIGPSGSGKTLLVKALAEALNVPVVIGDATTLTETGYVGEDVESLLVKLYLASGGDFGKAQSGIVFIDEIDKLAGRTSTVRDIGGEGVQHALLKMIEGFVSFIPTKLGPRHPGEETVPVRHDRRALHLRRGLPRPGGDHLQASWAGCRRVRLRGGNGRASC